ncbi:hypothetical protein EZS27_012340 [termite gut metagenome]|uniref:Uncharacterized protein n=1 Tax=termite gut metagenome TaxID=433724 RepID=A0A5J4S211_9ZZZZ
MTLKEAQKMYSDAVSTKVTHKPFSLTAKDLIQLAQHWNTPAKILFMRIGKSSSQVIFVKTSIRRRTTQSIIFTLKNYDNR